MEVVDSEVIIVFPDGIERKFEEGTTIGQVFQVAREMDCKPQSLQGLGGRELAQPRYKLPSGSYVMFAQTERKGSRLIVDLFFPPLTLLPKDKPMMRPPPPPSCKKRKASSSLSLAMEAEVVSSASRETTSDIMETTRVRFSALHSHIPEESQ